MKSKGMALFDVIVAALAGLFVFAVLIVILTQTIQTPQRFFRETLASQNDPACLAQGLMIKLTSKNDKDNDKRPDFCDMCVCDGQCPNGEDSNNDKSTNGIPDGCRDADDSEDPWWHGCKKENKDDAFAGKKSGNIIILNKKEKLWQCHLSSSATKSVPQTKAS